jgi:hypothetical protein
MNNVSRMHMVRKLSWLVVLLAILVTPLQADLRIVSRLEVRKVADTDPGNQFLAMIGNAMAQQLEQMNGMTMVTVIGDDVIRTEMSRPMGGMAAGTVTIMRADGTMVGLNSADETFFKATMPDVSQLVAVGMMPTVTVDRTGEFSTLLEYRVERVMLEMTMPLPAEVRDQLPPGLPSEIRMRIENWTAEALATYGTQMLRGNPVMAALGLEAAADIGFALRQIVRSELFGGYEMETVVVSVAEEDVPDALFEIPAGYREVPPPPGFGGGATMGSLIDKPTGAR